MREYNRDYKRRPYGDSSNSGGFRGGASRYHSSNSSSDPYRRSPPPVKYQRSGPLPYMEPVTTMAMLPQHINNNNINNNNTMTTTSSTPLLSGNTGVLVAPTTTATAAPAAAPTATIPIPYHVFLSSPVRSYDRLLRGVFMIDEPRFRAPPPVANCNIVIPVDVNLWNSYWDAFFSTISPHEALLKQQLMSEILCENARQRVVVKGNLKGVLTSPADVSGYPRDVVALCRAADAVAPVLAMHMRDEEFCVDFSTRRMAQLFMYEMMHNGVVLSSGYRMGGDMWPSQNSSNNNINNKIDYADEYFRRHGNVFTVLCDKPRESLTTPDPLGCRHVLALGPRTDLPPPYVEALFHELFHANVEYNTSEQYYLLSFPTIAEARYCHALLHRSLQCVFGLSLLQRSGTNQWMVPSQSMRFL